MLRVLTLLPTHNPSPNKVATPHKLVTLPPQLVTPQLTHQQPKPTPNLLTLKMG